MKLWMSAMMAAGLVAAVQAQDKPADPYAWVDAAVKRMAQPLNMTEEQIAKTIEKAKAALAEQAKIREAASAEIAKDLGEETFAKVKDQVARILSGSQGGGLQGRGGGNLGTQMYDRIEKELSLTPAQIEKIKPIYEESSKKIREMFTSAQGQGRDAFREIGQKVQEEMKAVSEKVKSELTDEQKTKFDELVKNMRQFGGGNGQPRQRGGQQQRRPAPQQ